MAPMADDWRVTVELPGEDEARELAQWLHDLHLDGAQRARLGNRVAVSRDDSVIFLYADNEEPAREAARLVQARIGHPAAGSVTLTRWHPVEQNWEDADVPLPTTEHELDAERDRQQDREAAESLASGHGAWEVRVELPHHTATEELADQLEADGLPVTRRFTFLLVGAVNEDEAHALAERIAEEAPAGARIEVEPGGQMAWEVTPGNPFAVFGGLGL
jgi:hypothetical protein